MQDIDQIINAYKGMVYGIALTRLGNRADADDVFQEVFITYFKKKMKFADKEHEKAWIIRVTLNCTKRVISTETKHSHISYDDQVLVDMDLIEEDRKLYSALNRLDDKYKMVLYLYYFETLSVKEIANHLKIRSGAVRMRMSRGRVLLKEIYEMEDKYE